MDYPRRGARSAWEEQLVEVDRLKTSIDDLKKSVNQLNDLKCEYQRQISRTGLYRTVWLFENPRISNNH